MFVGHHLFSMCSDDLWKRFLEGFCFIVRFLDNSSFVILLSTEDLLWGCSSPGRPVSAQIDRSAFDPLRVVTDVAVVDVKHIVSQVHGSVAHPIYQLVGLLFDVL